MPETASEPAPAVPQRDDRVNQGDFGRLVVLIPAFEPEAILIEVIEALKALGFSALLVVDDGSGPEYRSVFDRLEREPGVEVLRHAVNLGKGAALKTGLNHALWRFPAAPGLITADADGQHRPDDILRVAEALAEHPDRLVLGARQFECASPWRSRLGNALTRILFRGLYGQGLIDTQTGLRGIPRSLIPALLRIQATGYEFELHMLVLARCRNMRIEQVPIETVYLEGNRTSHFRPIRDSLRVYAVLLQFLAIALLAAVIDSGLFALVLAGSGILPLAQISARILAVLVSLQLNRRWLSRLAAPPRRLAARQLALVGIFAAASYALLLLLHQVLGCSLLAAKLIAEGVLFSLNFRWLRDQLLDPPDAARRPQSSIAS